MKKLLKTFKKKLKMVDYEDDLGYQNLKLCLCVPYKKNKKYVRVYRLNPLRTKYKGLFNGLVTDDKPNNKFLSYYTKIDENRYQKIGLHWM